MVRDQRPPQLQPPPRAGGNSFRKQNDHDRRPKGPGKFGLAALFTFLIAALIGVFVVLPRWTETHPSDVMQRTPSASPPIAEERAIAPTPQATAAATFVPSPSPTPRPAPTRGPEDTENSPRRSARRIDGEFADLMSRGLTALDLGQWQVARKTFEAASRLRPNAPEVADGLARVAAAERRDLVMTGIDRGRGFEEAERWAEAEGAYAQVLTVDPEAAHALTGRERAALRASLDEQLEFHIANPGRLSSPSVFDDAAGVLGEAREVTPRGPRISGQVERLEEILAAASTPVSVVLESDNATDIVVYRVGRMGTFTRREINLRPGSYTAVGSRDGYRDIRIRFDVTRAAPQKPVKIVCTEAL